MDTHTSLRKKPGSPLTLYERTIIEVRYRDGKSLTAIAVELFRNKGTISREIGGKPRTGHGRYRAERSHALACERIEQRGNVSRGEYASPPSRIRCFKAQTRMVSRTDQYSATYRPQG